MSDTPRTDMRASGIIGFFSCETVPAGFARDMERENARLREHMTEAWELVNAMAGQEYWQRAADWLAENRRFAPEGIVSDNDEMRDRHPQPDAENRKDH
jgi:hypothetical protein